MKCEICGKAPQFGYNVSHSKVHTKRRWMPNIHPVTLTIDGKRQHVNACTRCIRTNTKLAKAT